MQLEQNSVVGVILAGGKSRRMGEDKTWLHYRGSYFIDHAIERAGQQVQTLLISSNQSAGRFTAYGLPVVADSVADRGPLAGILAAMRWSVEHSAAAWVASFAVDSPFFPLDLVSRMCFAAQRQSVPIVIAASSRVHPVFSLCRVSLWRSLECYLQQGEGRMLGWMEQHPCATVRCLHADTDPFLNVNTPKDLQRLIAPSRQRRR